MTKRYCDLCGTEINNGWYNINVSYQKEHTIHPSFLKLEDICEECYSRIYETINAIRYGNNDDCAEDVVEEES